MGIIFSLCTIVFYGNQCCGAGAGAATFWAAPEPEPIFFLVGAGAALFKAALAASFRQAKKKSLVLVSNMTLKAV